MFLRHSIVAVALAFAALLEPCVVHACSVLLPAVKTFGPGAQVPGNLVFFEVLEDGAGDVAFELVDTESGRTIPASMRTIGGDRVFAPDTALAPGLRLALLEHHGTGPQDTDAELGADARVYEFTTGPHVTPVIDSGKLTLLEHDGDRAVFLYEAPEQVDLDHLRSVRITVDGRPLGTIVQGEQIGVSPATSVMDPPKPVQSARSRTLIVRTSCDGTHSEDSCGGQYDFEEGEHELVVAPHVAGLEVQPTPLRQTVEVRCPEAGCRVGSSRDAGLLVLPLYLLLMLRRYRAGSSR